MAAHRYWRVRFDGSTGTGAQAYIWLQEVSFRSATDTDLSTGGTALSSGNWDGAYLPAQAFDKSLTGNGWRSPQGVFPSWIGYDHGTPVDVRSVLLTQHSSTAVYPSGKVLVDYSDDGTNWVNMPSSFTSGVNSAGAVWTVYASESTQSLRYLPVLPRYVPGYNLEPQSPRRRLWAKGGYWRWETQTTGSGTISGIVTIENIPGSRKVRLYRKHDGMLLRETWSAPNGAYSFSNLDPAWEYFVVAHDHLRVYNGVIQDMITP